MEPGWVWGEEDGQGMVCECLRGALKEAENKGNAVTGEGNLKKKKTQLCIKKHLLPLEEGGSEPGPPAHRPDDTVQVLLNFSFPASFLSLRCRWATHVVYDSRSEGLILANLCAHPLKCS